MAFCKPLNIPLTKYVYIDLMARAISYYPCLTIAHGMFNSKYFTYVMFAFFFQPILMQMSLVYK